MSQWLAELCEDLLPRLESFYLSAANHEGAVWRSRDGNPPRGRGFYSRDKLSERLMTTLLRGAVILLCASPILGITACGDSNAPKVGTAVNVKDNEFEPPNLQVTASQTVTWTWSGSAPHTVTFDAGGTNSTQMTTGTFQRAFPTTGIFSYHCLVHGTSMSGIITVQ